MGKTQGVLAFIPRLNRRFAADRDSIATIRAPGIISSGATTPTMPPDTGCPGRKCATATATSTTDRATNTSRPGAMTGGHARARVAADWRVSLLLLAVLGAGA